MGFTKPAPPRSPLEAEGSSEGDAMRTATTLGAPAHGSEGGEISHVCARHSRDALGSGKTSRSLPGNPGARPRSATQADANPEKYGYSRFSEVPLSDDSDTSTSGGVEGNGRRSQPGQQQQRARKHFLVVMGGHGLRVRKHHRHTHGCADRVIRYDTGMPGLRWKSHKWWKAGSGQVPLKDVLDVEREGTVVWLKCLHLGNIGFETALEGDAETFYLAMDTLLDQRPGPSVGPTRPLRL